MNENYPVLETGATYLMEMSFGGGRKVISSQTVCGISDTAYLLFEPYQGRHWVLTDHIHGEKPVYEVLKKLARGEYYIPDKGDGFIFSVSEIKPRTLLQRFFDKLFNRKPK